MEWDTDGLNGPDTFAEITVDPESGAGGVLWSWDTDGVGGTDTFLFDAGSDNRFDTVYDWTSGPGFFMRGDGSTA